ncbi:thermonuclease family protein [Azospirillum agricola]|uniref:thermonuclease family protein n=1 Tax=Azospirillum agricola TaxID=1720247 RepID=UPI000A0F24FB|nr:thermonuclease family protein [Azospirillum agricola]SMH59050.1 Endonuclease YncB, thermonuclease family [Azospirillum lipoferum]
MTSRRCSDRLAAVLLAALTLFGCPVYASAQTAGPTKGKVAATPNETLKGKAVAAEGDLLVINDTPVRLMGIDAPDPGQKCKNRYGHELDCFKIATAVLAAMVKDEEVTCTVSEKDRTGERKGECRVRGVDLGAAMVSRGWAFHYASLSAAYQKGEAYAQSKRMGLWAGQVEKPWQWRSRQVREKSR